MWERRDYLELFASFEHVSHLNKILGFSANPWQDMFNQIVELGGDLYDENEEPDLVDDLYIELEGETPTQRRIRIDEVKKRISDKKAQSIGFRKIRFSDPLILSFVHAATTTFPHLVADCSLPLLIERAYKFTNGSYAQLSYLVQRGPVQRRNVEGKANSLDGDESLESAFRRWQNQVITYFEHCLVRAGGSGNTWYITSALEIISQFNGLTYTLRIPHLKRYLSIWFVMEESRAKTLKELAEDAEDVEGVEDDEGDEYDTPIKVDIANEF